MGKNTTVEAENKYEKHLETYHFYHDIWCFPNRPCERCFECLVNRVKDLEDKLKEGKNE